MPNLSNKLDKHVSSSLSEKAGIAKTNRWYMVSIIKNSLYPKGIQWKVGTHFSPQCAEELKPPGSKTQTFSFSLSLSKTFLYQTFPKPNFLSVS